MFLGFIRLVNDVNGDFKAYFTIPVMASKSNDLVDIVIRVTEREFGVIEVAPGFRTDIGLKLSTKLSSFYR